jgi:hypothetical protein
VNNEQPSDSQSVRALTKKMVKTLRLEIQNDDDVQQAIDILQRKIPVNEETTIQLYAVLLSKEKR